MVRDVRHAVQLHEGAWFRATYYAWMARKGSSLAGGDPITGRPRRSTCASDAADGRVAYLALARRWFAIARRLRVRVLP